MESTIAGIATAPGEGGIAIVRLSGPDAVRMFEKAFRAPGKTPPYPDHLLMHGFLTDGEEKLDEVMGVVMRAPRTYTREDVCEIHTHGGDTAAMLALRLLIRLGAEPAGPGEFTRRAFVNGRIDLMQAEAVMGVISARSAAAMKAEERQLAGGMSGFVKSAQEELTRLLAGLEAHIDYPDEIAEEEALAGLNEGLNKLTDSLERAVDYRAARVVREGLRVALCGCPNAGKSTLFNTFLGEEKAIVTEIPGTTRDVLDGSFVLDGFRVILQDTAGLRDSSDPVERIGVGRAYSALRQADAALLLIDGAKPLTAEEKDLLKQPLPCPGAVLLTKADAGSVIGEKEASGLADGLPVFRVSARSGAGLENVRNYLRSMLRAPREDMLLHERHMALAQEAAVRLRQARRGLENGCPVDFAAIDLHEALYILGRITGDSVDEALLDDIFSRFCVGK